MGVSGGSFSAPGNTKGNIVWRDQPLYLTEALRGELVGLAPRDDGDWAIRFRGFDLAVLDDVTGVVRRSGLARTGGSASMAMADGGSCAAQPEVAS